MKIGSKKVADSNFNKRFRVTKMDFNQKVVLRIVNGPEHRYFHMWPTIEEDQATMAIKATWRGVTVEKDQKNVLDTLAEVDASIKKEIARAAGDEKKAERSTLRKSDRFDYAVIIRNVSEFAGKVSIMETNWTVHNAIQQTKNKKSVTDDKKLFHGLPYMYDIVIEKIRNPKTRQPDYTIEVMENPYRGQVPIEYLDEEKYPMQNREAFFTAEDLALINETQWELEDQDKPVGPDKVLEMLRTFPIALGQRNKENNKFLFFQTLADLKALQNFAVSNTIPIYLPRMEELTPYLTAPEASAHTPATNMTQAPALPPAGAVNAEFKVEPPAAPSPVIPPQMGSGGMPMAEKVPPTRPEAPSAAPPWTPAPAPAAPAPAFQQATAPVTNQPPAASPAPGQPAPVQQPPATPFKQPKLW